MSLILSFSPVCTPLSHRSEGFEPVGVGELANSETGKEGGHIGRCTSGLPTNREKGRHTGCIPTIYTQGGIYGKVYPPYTHREAYGRHTGLYTPGYGHMGGIMGYIYQVIHPGRHTWVYTTWVYTMGGIPGYTPPRVLGETSAQRGSLPPCVC